jgi:hypothetical protein
MIAIASLPELDQAVACAASVPPIGVTPKVAPRRVEDATSAAEELCRAAGISPR